VVGSLPPLRERCPGRRTRTGPTLAPHCSEQTRNCSIFAEF